MKQHNITNAHKYVLALQVVIKSIIYEQIELITATTNVYYQSQLKFNVKMLIGMINGSHVP